MPTVLTRTDVVLRRAALQQIGLREHRYLTSYKDKYSSANLSQHGWLL